MIIQHAAPGRGRLCVVCSQPAAPLVAGPPPSYDHRVLRAQSEALIGRQHPSLLPLVHDGTLVALERPAGYAERRTDGYQEPLQVFLVGTAHVSQRSAEDVRRVVRAVQPDAVVVELCRSRQAYMYQADEPGAAEGQQEQRPGSGAAALMSAGLGGSTDDEDAAASGQASSSSTSSSSISASSSASSSSSSSSSASSSSSSSSSASSSSSSASSSSASSSASSSSSSRAAAANPLSLSGGGLLSAFQRSMELGGASALVLRLALGRLSARLSGSLGVQGGAEFVAARQEAEALGAQLVLGDRPVEITLQRAWDALSWRRRGELAAALAGSALSVQQQEIDVAAIERLKEDDAVSLLFAQLSEAYPEVVAPLVHERDLYLAWSLKRSKAVNGARAVVGVVGKGHLRGVCYALTHDAAGAQLRFRDLVGGKNVKADRQRQRLQAVGRFAFDTALFTLLWWAWTQLQSAAQ